MALATVWAKAAGFDSHKRRKEPLAALNGLSRALDLLRNPVAPIRDTRPTEFYTMAPFCLGATPFQIPRPIRRE
jgi:hypothetical protein